MLISHRANFSARKTIMNKAQHYIIINGSTFQKDIKILTLQAPKHRAPKCMRQNLIELQQAIDGSTTIAGDRDSPLPEMGRAHRQEFRKDTEENSAAPSSNGTLWQLHPTISEYTLFSGPPGTFTKISHIPGHKTHNFKKSHKVYFQTRMELKWKSATVR